MERNLVGDSQLESGGKVIAEQNRAYSYNLKYEDESGSNQCELCLQLACYFKDQLLHFIAFAERDRAFTTVLWCLLLRPKTKNPRELDILVHI